MGRPRFHLDHLFAKRRLSAYIDDELEPIQRRRVQLHIDQCAGCSRAERSLTRLLHGLHHLRSRRPVGLADGTIERVRRVERPPERAGRP